MSTFKSALAICGLSYRGAAEFFEQSGCGPVSEQTIKDMARGKSLVGDDKWKALSDLYARIEDAADFASARIELEGMDRRAKMNISSDDGVEPLPNGAPEVAGAMALLLTIREYGN